MSDAEEPIVAMTYDWDEWNIAHLARHNISPAEAEQAMETSIEAEVQDDEFDGEHYKQTGETASGRILKIVSTFREDKVRVVTAWDAPKADRLVYLEIRARIQ